MQSKYFLASDLSSSLHGHLGSLFGRRHLLGDGVECIIFMGFFSEGIDYLCETWQLCLMKACGLFAGDLTALVDESLEIIYMRPGSFA